MEINPLVPKMKIFKAFYHIWARKPSGHVTNIILTYLHFLVPKSLYTCTKFGKKGQAVSENKTSFNFDMKMTLGQSKNDSFTFIYSSSCLHLPIVRPQAAIVSQKSTVFTFSYRKV